MQISPQFQSRNQPLVIQNFKLKKSIRLKNHQYKTRQLKFQD